ncbi:MAG: mannitol-1-phosphate 5-dehydrogenase [Candidatus Hydrogenedentes bacterium]|nr:mannitol-1-phosphate 5-dehydrogenase [Candidatus Hydrogenedentota bacterium]
MMRAVHFGAGKIGRGFLGQLYYQSGYHTTFIDVVPEIVGALQSRGGYPVYIACDDPETVAVSDVTAVHGTDLDAVARAIAAADIASTAVGVNVLDRIAGPIAEGLRLRFADPEAAPLDFIVCENLIEAGDWLRARVRAALPPELHGLFDARVGFVDASIGRMVPLIDHPDDPLFVAVEPYCDLPIDKSAFRAGIPPIVHLQPRDNFGAYVERKLFVHNMSHAATGYLGYLKGHEYTWQAVADPDVRGAVEAALAESCEGLHRKHGLPLVELREHGQDLLRRYGNRALGDQILRVAADPVRKLGPNDRLIGAARMCLEQGVNPAAIAFAAAAALRYDPPGDAGAQSIQSLLNAQGLSGVLFTVCQLPADSPLTGILHAASERLDREGWRKQDH